MSSEYIYTMYKVDKFYGADRQVLANISLSFFPGAKIGVLGPNGAGKSTVLRIMAGKEEPSSGVAELAPNATVGLLEQEPELDPAKTVRANTLAAEAVHLMETHRITALVVVDADDVVVGALNVHDLLRAGVV